MITQKKYLHSQLLCDDNYPNIIDKIYSGPAWREWNLSLGVYSMVATSVLKMYGDHSLELRMSRQI